ncbi:MAG: hypothetical protein VB050_04750 [Geobacteraceae bacterium]|nr:hypothetical protein [Geobacteraceae bacterium]
MKDAFTIDGLHVIGVESDSDQRLRWATWGIHSKRGMSIVLSLLSNTSNGISTLWTMKKNDCYEPRLIRLTSWQYGQYPIVALTFHYGSLAKQIEFYGIDTKNRPVILAKKFGEMIESSINSKEEGLVKVYLKTNTHMTSTCYQWNQKKYCIEKAQCE